MAIVGLMEEIPNEKSNKFTVWDFQGHTVHCIIKISDQNL